MLNILGMGAYHTGTTVDNQFLENLQVGTTAQWILEKIGIKTRLTTLPIDHIRETRNQDLKEAIKAASHSPTEMAIEAAKEALSRANIKASDLGLIICNGCTPRQLIPTEAQSIAKALGINVKAYDVFTACPAFALHLDYLGRFNSEKLPEYIMCVSTATLTQKVNYNERSDGAIWGDGAAAWIISPRQEGRLKVLETSFNADPTRWGAVVVDTFGYFHQDGRAVRDFSVRQTVRLIKRLELHHQLDWNRDIFIGHQANATMLEQIIGNREIPASNHWHNVGELGNQAGAGAPATLAMHWDKLEKGQKIVVAVVGAGLSWGSVLLEVQ